MATPRNKKIKKIFTADIDSLVSDGIGIQEFLRGIDKAIATISVEVEEFDEYHEPTNVRELATIHFVGEDYAYYNNRCYLKYVATINVMETQKQAEQREARAEKAKKSKEENARKKKEKDLKILEKLRKMYG